MSKKTETPAELEDKELDRAEGGASGLPTGKHQHRPYLVTSIAHSASDTTDDGAGKTATITYTGLE